MPAACGNGCDLEVLSWVVFPFSFFCLCSFFGHFSHRSEWQLIKIDYKSIYSRKCTEEDYQTWHLHNQVGEVNWSYFQKNDQIWHSSILQSCFGNRASLVWWDRNKFSWNEGLGTTACWEGTTPESSQPRPAFAELTTLNGKTRFKQQLLFFEKTPPKAIEVLEEVEVF